MDTAKLGGHHFFLLSIYLDSMLLPMKKIPFFISTYVNNGLKAVRTAPPLSWPNKMEALFAAILSMTPFSNSVWMLDLVISTESALWSAA